MVQAPPRHAGVYMTTRPEVGGLACAKMIEQPPVLVDMLVRYIHRVLPHLLLVCLFTDPLTTPHAIHGRSSSKLENNACCPPFYSQHKRTKPVRNLNHFSRRISRTHMVTNLIEFFFFEMSDQNKLRKNNFELSDFKK